MGGLIDVGTQARAQTIIKAIIKAIARNGPTWSVTILTQTQYHNTKGCNESSLKKQVWFSRERRTLSIESVGQLRRMDSVFVVVLIGKRNEDLDWGSG